MADQQRPSHGDPERQRPAPGSPAKREVPGPGANDVALEHRLDALIEESSRIWERFDREVRDDHWHPFVASDYQRVRRALESLQPAGEKFLEWGSATGAVTIMADMLGFDAWGIELDSQLATTARDLARRHQSHAHFFTGSFVPSGYRFHTPGKGDGRLGTIGDGESAYPAMGCALDDFDFVFAYPWMGEEALMLDVMRQYGSPGARLLLHGDEGVRIYSGGRLLSTVA